MTHRIVCRHATTLQNAAAVMQDENTRGATECPMRADLGDGPPATSFDERRKRASHRGHKQSSWSHTHRSEQVTTKYAGGLSKDARLSKWPAKPKPRTKHAAIENSRQHKEVRSTTKSRSHNSTNMFKKPLEQMPAGFLLRKALGTDHDMAQWRERIAKARSIRLPILILQDILRQDASTIGGPSKLLDLLPTKEESETLSNHAALAAHDREALNYYTYVLRGLTDDERCERYLERPGGVPMFIFNFLVRPSSHITKVSTLQSLIEMSQLYYDSSNLVAANAKGGELMPSTRSDKLLDMNQANFILLMRLLVRQCLRLEPRFIVKLADAASEYIKNVGSYSNEERKLFLMQCDIFNDCLKIFRPQPHMQAIQRSMPNAYFWEAQRILLSMSATLEKPLLVSKGGFRSIRDVLAGQPKNQTETHSSGRHSPNWPPYLQPGDGMDERTDPEDNWSRTVSAGMLMQEAGFAKDELDDAVDILQGMTLDGTPTIQQRSTIGSNSGLGIWEASIRATRNAQEAWERFRTPPEPGSKPGPEHYGAMFQKLFLREAEANSRVLPGDKALNFATQIDANLAEFERARRRPPSVTELYQHMRLNGVAPQGPCLRILLANADSLETAHQYLRDGPEKARVIRSLTSDDIEPPFLRMVPISLFAAYLQAYLRMEGRRGGNQLMRAVRLAEIRLHTEQSRWVPFIWGLILKSLAQHHKALRISLTEQLRLILHVTDVISQNQGVQLSTFAQFHKCIRKAVKRELKAASVEGSGGSQPTKLDLLQTLYYGQESATLEQQAEITPGEKNETTALSLFTSASARMKDMAKTLVQQELDAKVHLERYDVAPLEQMNTRRDPVRSDDAHEYMLSLAYLGQFAEMGKLLHWLMSEWDSLNVISAIHELDEPPPFADFFETLCAFRLLAEPMLDEDTLSSLRQTMAASRLDWTWPDDEAVSAYADVHDDESINTLRRVVELARSRLNAVV